MNKDYRERRLLEIDRQISEAEGNKNTGTILMIVSLFMLWPLAIVGIVIYFNANSKIKRLKTEKINIIAEQWIDESEIT